MRDQPMQGGTLLFIPATYMANMLPELLVSLTALYLGGLGLALAALPLAAATGLAVRLIVIVACKQARRGSAGARERGSAGARERGRAGGREGGRC